MTRPVVTMSPLLALAAAALAAGVPPDEPAPAEDNVSRLRRAARENGYRFTGDGDAVRCVPVAVQTAEQGERALYAAAQRRARMAAKRKAGR